MVIDYGIRPHQPAPRSDVLLIRLGRNDIHYTAQWSAPSPGGVTRLCADENDKMARDWFREQTLAMGAEYQVSLSLQLRAVRDD
jgi:hypothetical protein